MVCKKLIGYFDYYLLNHLNKQNPESPFIDAILPFSASKFQHSSHIVVLSLNPPTFHDTTNGPISLTSLSLLQIDELPKLFKEFGLEAEDKLAVLVNQSLSQSRELKFFVNVSRLALLQVRHFTELEQAIRRILIHGRYEPPTVGRPTRSSWLAQAENGELNAGDLLSAYCRMLHDRFGTYEEVASPHNTTDPVDWVITADLLWLLNNSDGGRQ